MKYNLSYDNKNIDTNFVAKMAKKFLLDERVVELLYGRGIKDENELKNFLEPNLSQLHDPYLFEDMKIVVEIIKKHIEQKSKILIFGDYDVDGITASAILLKFFDAFGIQAFNFLPNRYEDGYGVNIPALEKIIEKYNPNLIITVDCGITAVNEAEFLKQKNIDIIITDHHEKGPQLPNCPIINPKTSNTYPFKSLCGSAVALKIVQAFWGLDNIDEYIAICSIATIADIVDLLDENRAIVKHGLAKQHLLPKGIRKLINVCGIKGEAKSSDIAFKVAPKLNASGRMGDADRSLCLYLENKDSEINKLVNDIISYNIKRQELCNLAYIEAKQMLAEKDIYHTPAVILSSPTWDSGILGIVAARISEEYNRPTFLFNQQGDELIGSSRSVNNVNIHSMLSQMTDILVKFGGHTMAAGLTIKVEKFDEFNDRVFEYVNKFFVNENFVPSKTYDFYLNVNDINVDFIKDIGRLEPCGHNNFRPIFLVKLKNTKVTSLKKYPEHLVMNLDNMSLLAFNSKSKYYTLSSGIENYVLADLDIDNYKNKLKISGIVKNIDYEDINRPTDNNILMAEYINQLAYNDTDKYQFSNYNREELIQILLNMNKAVFGTLFIAYDYNTYLNFKSIYDSNDIIRNRIFSIDDQTGLNTILLAPTNFDNFNTFNRIVFLDPVLHTGFLSALNKATKATIFLPHKTQFSFSIFRNVSTNREIFGKYFRLIEYIAQNNMSDYNLYNLFINATKLINPKFKYNYLQFAVCLSVFSELGLITYDKNNIKLNITNNKSTLNASSFYNRLNMLKISGECNE